MITSLLGRRRHGSRVDDTPSRSTTDLQQSGVGRGRVEDAAADPRKSRASSGENGATRRPVQNSRSSSLLASLDRFVEHYTEGTACSDVAPHLCSDGANFAEPARSESCDGDDLFDDLDIDWDASTTTGAAVTPRESNRDGFAMAPSNGSGHSSNRTGRLREAPFLLGPRRASCNAQSSHFGAHTRIRVLMTFGAFCKRASQPFP